MLYVCPYVFLLTFVPNNRLFIKRISYANTDIGGIGFVDIFRCKNVCVQFEGSMRYFFRLIFEFLLNFFLIISDPTGACCSFKIHTKLYYCLDFRLFSIRNDCLKSCRRIKPIENWLHLTLITPLLKETLTL